MKVMTKVMTKLEIKIKLELESLMVIGIAFLCAA